jgi:hypothetical protein
MIRILFGSALPILGLGVATALLGPDLVTGPRGEPLMVAGPKAASFQQASFDGAACGFPLVLGEEALPSADPTMPTADTHVVTLAFRSGADGVSIAIERGATNPDADEALLLVFDDEGRIVALIHPPSLRERMLAETYAGCMDSDAKPAHAGI